jgi:hypothetical protein
MCTFLSSWGTQSLFHSSRNRYRMYCIALCLFRHGLCSIELEDAYTVSGHLLTVSYCKQMTADPHVNSFCGTSVCYISYSQPSSITSPTNDLLSKYHLLVISALSHTQQPSQYGLPERDHSRVIGTVKAKNGQKLRKLRAVAIMSRYRPTYVGEG